ncbi:hypothetical protein [Bacillus sp. B15-48]|uniref:hypothetical protein n=1 Tax=Bacillus sp. B15-48 TaxID=1548601 RepID=UPI00193F2B1E|nr:hypothetical protein [Bacillus sp. B15-48]MBM4763539.1 hypothetical protein [Bacillus sp. B15-48]
MSMADFADIYRICYGNGYEEIEVEDIIKMSKIRRLNDAKTTPTATQPEETMNKETVEAEKELVLV